MSTPLRKMLAERVALRRQADEIATATVPQGAFTHLDAEEQIHFATIGRKTGLRRVKYWLPWAPWGDTLYNVEEIGTRADWVKNVLANPAVEVWGRDHEIIRARARLVIAPAEVTLVRNLLAHRVDNLGVGWEIEHGLLVAFDAD